MGQSAARIAIVAGKGGVGKTTTTVNLGAAIAERRVRVLMVDCDPQSNLTATYGLDPYAPRPTIGDVLCGRERAADAIVATRYDYLDILPAHPDLSAVEAALHSSIGRELLLRDALLTDGVDESYGVVLFDTPPSFGFHTLSAMAAAQYVLVPLQMSGYAFRGLKEVLRAVVAARKGLNSELRLLGAVPTFVSRTNFSREMLSVLGDVAPIRSFSASISQTVKLQETSLACAPITAYAKSSKPAVEYRALADEVLGALADMAPPVAETPAGETMLMGHPAPNGTLPQAASEPVDPHPVAAESRESTMASGPLPVVAGAPGAQAWSPAIEPPRSFVHRFLRRN